MRAMLTHIGAMTPMTTQTQRKPRATQPVDVLHIADALLKIQTVEAVTGLTQSSIYRKVGTGDFPKPIKDGPRCTRWRASAVTAWLQSRGEGASA